MGIKYKINSELLNPLIRKHNNGRKFRKFSVIELSELMEFLKEVLQTKKGNWSLHRFEEFINHTDTQPRHACENLEIFYKEYSSRKKTNKSFEGFLKKIKQKTGYHVQIEKYKLVINDKGQRMNFLQELKDIKTKYLTGADIDFLEIIDKNIDIGLTKSTLCNYFYSKLT